MLADPREHQVASLEDPFADSLTWTSAPSLFTRISGGPYSLRDCAYNCYTSGRYEEGLQVLSALLASSFEPPDTLAHLARMNIMMGSYEAAFGHTERAWEMRERADGYVVPRIIWMQIALRHLLFREAPASSWLREFACALGDCGSYSWTVEPMLSHLRAVMPPSVHELLTTMASVMSDHDKRPSLDNIEVWRLAMEEPASALA